MNLIFLLGCRIMCVSTFSNFYVFITPFLGVFQYIFEALFSRLNQITEFFLSISLEKIVLIRAVGEIKITKV